MTMLDKFQQSMLEKLEVPRFQFLDRLVDIPVGFALALHSAHCVEDRGVPQVKFLVMVLTCPLLCSNRSRP